MSDNKTKPTSADVTAYLETVDNEVKRADCFELIEIMEKVTGEPATMWGETMVGFGSYHYKYATGREGDYFLTGFAPRKQALTLYIMAGFDDYDDLMEKLGKYKTGKSCLYVKKLDDIDRDVLKTLIKKSVEHMRQAY